VKYLLPAVLLVLSLMTTAHGQMISSRPTSVDPVDCPCPMAIGSQTIAVEHAWARATPTGARTGAAFATLLNKATTDDLLLGASTPIAQKVQFHSETNDNGIMKMRQLSSITLHPGAPVILKPGAIHIMMIGLKQPLKKGQSFLLTLDFEKAGQIEVKVPVIGAGAMTLDNMDSGTDGTGMQ
jgi:copper(I)-binding protein